MLSEIPDLQVGMPHDVTAVEFLLAQQNSQQRTFARSVATDEADLRVVRNRRIRPVQ